MKVLKLTLIFIMLTALLLVIVYYYFQWSIQPKIVPKNTNTIKFEATRLSNKPIVFPTMHPLLKEEASVYGYTNINGPSLIKVPNWVDNRLGNYYLYFAHHKGRFIRLAYADTLTGAWTMHDQEIMPLSKSGFATEASPALGIVELKKYLAWTEFFAMSTIGSNARKAWEKRNNQQLKSSPPTTPHVASPEIYIDETAKKIRLYYHGVTKGNLQMSKVALSADGLNFKPEPGIIGVPYMRVFKHKKQFYSFAMPGFLYHSKDGLSNFNIRNKWLFGTDVRHAAIYKNNNDLYLFYTKVGDQPEQILCSKIDISSDDWNDWTAEAPQVVLKPTLTWEGADQPLQPSMRGEMGIKVNQLRDPAIFEEDGKIYLLYTGGGEQAIGIAELNTQ